MGNNDAWERVRAWLQGPQVRPLVVVGPCGSGKTYGVQELAKECNIDMFALCSDERQSPESVHFAMGATKCKLQRRVTALADDAETLDRDVITALSKHARVVITCADYWDPVLRPLHAVVDPKQCVTLHNVPAEVLARVLGQGDPRARKTAYECQGDVRQFQIRMRLQLPVHLDTRFTTIFERATYLMSADRDGAERARAFLDDTFVVHLLHATYPHCDSDDVCRIADAFEGYSLCRGSEESAYAVANVLRYRTSVRPRFPFKDSWRAQTGRTRVDYFGLLEGKPQFGAK